MGGPAAACAGAGVVGAAAAGGAEDEDGDGDAAPSLLVAPSADDATTPPPAPDDDDGPARRPGDNVLTAPPGDALDLLEEGQGLAVAGGRGDSGGLLVLVHVLIGAGIGTVRLT